MPWTTLGTKPTWNVTDSELLARMEYALLENGSNDADGVFLTTQFTVQETLDNSNLAQQQFLKDTAAIHLRVSQGSTPGQPRYALPPDWIMTRRITWQAAGGSIRSLARTDAFDLDHQMPDWQQSLDDPTVYNDGSDLPTLTIEIAKAPAQAGQMTLSYVPQPATLTGAGVLLNVPDEFESAILYGALGEMLGSEGEAYDPERAQYCEQRYNLCVELANALIQGAD